MSELEAMRKRYQDLRAYCLRRGDRHPDSTLPCHRAMGRDATSLEYQLALLADDFMLALERAHVA